MSAADMHAMDIVVGIDRRGVVHVLKHRTANPNDVEAEVKLVVTTRSYDTYTTEAKNTGLVAPIPTTVRGTAKRVAVDQPAIRNLLRDAAANNEWVKITGVKVSGEDYQDRLVRPISVNARPVGLPDAYALYCEDGTSRETRTFHVENMSRAEIVEVA